MRKQRQRVNISLAAEDYAQVERLAQAGGFKNVCAFVRALLIQVSQYAARRRMSAHELARQPTTINEDIAAMFAELIDWDAATPAQQRAALMANEKTLNNDTQTQ